MRSSYVNWFYEYHKKLSDRELLANQMRHSVMTSQRNYLKVDLKNDAEEYKDKDKQELIQEIIKSNNKKFAYGGCGSKVIANTIKCLQQARAGKYLKNNRQRKF